MTTSELTKKAIEILQKRGCEVWRVNNVPVQRRKNTVKKGRPDIQGYHKINGVFIGCECKNEGDKLSEDQKIFLLNGYKCGIIAMIAHVKNGEVILTDIQSFLNGAME